MTTSTTTRIKTTSDEFEVKRATCNYCGRRRICIIMTSINLGIICGECADGC